MAFSLLKILEPFWLFNFHLFQPQASPNPLPQSRRIPTQPSHCPRVSSAPSQLLLKFWGRLLPGPGVGLAAAGSWRRGQVEVELRQATGGLGHAGLGRQKKSKKSQLEKSKKSQKKSNVRILALADYWRQQKVKKMSKKEKRHKKSKVEKVKKVKQKKQWKKLKKVKCENQARILALADYWRQQKVKKKV